METRILLFILIALAMISVVTEIIQLLLINTHSPDQKDKESDREMEAIVAQTREKSTSIIHKATALANKMLTNAELRGIGVVAHQKLEAGKLAHDYEEQMRQMEAAFAQKMQEVSEGSQTRYENFAKSLETALTAQMQENQKLLNQKSTDLVGKAQTQLNEFLTQMHGKIEQQLDRELTRARQEISEYKTHRMRVIDAHIVELLEKTVAIALGKRLDLGSDSDMIYKALQEAKQDNALS